MIAGLIFALGFVLAAGSALLNSERKRHEKEENRIRRESEENAKQKAKIISEANKIKNEAETGNHSDDVATMASQLQNYASKL